jgi:hypothetical protein
MTTTAPVKLSDAEVRTIIENARQLAADAVAVYLAKQPEGYCGFAWVNIKPARGQFVKVLKEMKLGRPDDYYGGYTFWNPSGNSTQNMDAKEEGARIFALELAKYGVKISVRSRLD